MTDLFEPLTPANPAAPAPRACLHPRAMRRIFDGGIACGRCGKELDESRIRRGRTSRNRGNSIEREIGHRLGLNRVGQFGGPDDLSGELFRVQVKSGGAFPERLWAWLRGVPATAQQTRLLVVTDAPGPGKRRRAVVVLDIDDWIALHGPAL